jgi:ElaA protein
MTWSLKKFSDLSTQELYAILQLRNEVFAIEQNCVYPDLDNRDQDSHHLMCWKEGKLVAYTRLLPPGLVYDEPSIGRVVTSPSVRNEGLGRLLMQRSIDEIYILYGHQPIRIGAQCYLIKFYNNFGFTISGDVYLEDGIEHIEMVKS